MVSVEASDDFPKNFIISRKLESTWLALVYDSQALAVGTKCEELTEAIDNEERVFQLSKWAMEQPSTQRDNQ